MALFNYSLASEKIPYINDEKNKLIYRGKPNTVEAASQQSAEIKIENIIKDMNKRGEVEKAVVESLSLLMFHPKQYYISPVI